MNDALHKQLISDLLIESFEGLDQYDRELLELEKGAGGESNLNTIFRIIHTLKGTSGCLGLGQIESVAHAGENLLDLLRSGKLAVHQEMISTLLALSDALREMLRNLEATGSPGQKDFAPLLARLSALQAGQAAPPPSADEAAPTLAIPASPAASEGWGLFGDESSEPAPGAVPEESAPAVDLSPVEPAAAQVQATAAASNGAGKPSAADSAIRVDVHQLDKLMNLVGELVLARNQIIQHANSTQEPNLQAVSQRLNLITTELQESVMKTRMQPIGNVWSKFPRIVRDVAHELGKKVRLIMEGQQTELDRTIIEAIKDPLTHVIRNAIDHGIEQPDRRAASDKPEEGMLILRAYHEGGQVNIEIMDDGAGINIAKVKAKAVQRNLITPDQAARLTEREALNLIFAAGLSTADKITNVSGRGVGMDVVKTNIEKIGGSVDVLSDLGRGTTLKIKIPLTLAIIPALIVTTGGDRYAIPQVSLLELVRLEGEQARKGIESLYGSPVYRLRGNLLPIVYLSRELKLKPKVEVAGEEVVNIIVVQADGHHFGLVVDEVNDTEEIVVKPLGQQLKGITVFAGATIMGDGRVALILDVMGLAHRARVVSESHDRSRLESKTAEVEAVDERQKMLLFSVGEQGRLAIPISMAARLEEFPRSKVERTADREVIQYRGQILPLIHVGSYLPAGLGGADTCPESLQVIVFSEQGRSVGLVVGRIHDIVEESVAVSVKAMGAGILGSAVIQNRVTDLLDVPGIIRAAHPAFYETAA